MMQNKLSIITITYNNREGLKNTIDSVVNQTYTDYQYIVIDGGSTDGSKELIESYGNKISYWVSERDAGIYNAMNKGIKVAGAEYCLFLNGGDFLVDNNVLANVFSQDINTDIAYGNMIIDWGKGKKTLGKMPDRISFYQMFTDTLWHPVSFIKRSLFEQYGYYDESYKMVADYDFFFKTIIANNISTQHLQLTISEYNTDGFSTRAEYKAIEISERRRVQEAYLPIPVIAYMNDVLAKAALKERTLNKRIIKYLKRKLR